MAREDVYVFSAQGMIVKYVPKQIQYIFKSHEREVALVLGIFLVLKLAVSIIDYPQNKNIFIATIFIISIVVLMIVISLISSMRKKISTKKQLKIRNSSIFK